MDALETMEHAFNGVTYVWVRQDVSDARVAAALETNRKLHRRVQKAEAAPARLQWERDFYERYASFSGRKPTVTERQALAQTIDGLRAQLENADARVAAARAEGQHQVAVMVARRFPLVGRSEDFLDALRALTDPAP